MCFLTLFCTSFKLYKALVFAAFIPYLSGAIGVVARLFLTPDQVNSETLNRVFEQGIHNNLVDRGFQEAYYSTSDEVVSSFSNNGFSKVLLRSVRGWGGSMAEQIYKLKDENPEIHKTVIDLINKTATEPSIIDMCWHAIYIGCKQ